MAHPNIPREEIVNLRSLERGDHIAVQGHAPTGEDLAVNYYHHGIYLGKGQVAEVGGTNKKDSKPREVSISEFLDGRGPIIRYIYPADKCNAPVVAARNAELIVGDPRLWRAYNLAVNNCEHFATTCKVGDPVSFQVCRNFWVIGSLVLIFTMIFTYFTGIKAGAVAVCLILVGFYLGA